MPQRPKKVKVKDNPSLVRDSFSKAIINVDRSNYSHAKKRKKHLLERESELTTLKNEMLELRALVNELVSRPNK